MAGIRIFLKKREIGQRDTGTERRTLSENEDRDGLMPLQAKEHPGFPAIHLKREERHRACSEPTLPYLDLELAASRTVKQ